MPDESGNKETKTTTLGPYSMGLDTANPYHETYNIDITPAGTNIQIIKQKITSSGAPLGETEISSKWFEGAGFASVNATKEWILSQHPNLYKTAASREVLEKALGAITLVNDQGEDYNLASWVFGDEPPPDSELSPEMLALKEKLKQDKLNQANQIQDVLTGFGNQCFYMENIVPFIAYAAGGKVKLSKEEKEQIEEGATSETKEQAQALENLLKGIKYSGEKKNGYGNKHLKLVSSKHPELIYNALLSDTVHGINAFQKGTPAMYSALTPQIKIFKIFGDDTEAQIPFSTHIASRPNGDITSFLEDRKGRADDVGILGFDFDYEQGNVALATNAKTVHAQLKLIFESVDSFTTVRNLKASGGKDGELRDVKFKFSDLITEGGKTPGGEEIKSADEYRIRVTVGYGVSPDSEGTIPGSSGFFDAAKALKTSMVLDTISYDLDFLETGQIVVTFDYAASIEERLGHPEFNIFGNELPAMKTALEKSKKVLAAATSLFGASLLSNAERQFTRSLSEAHEAFRGSIVSKVYKLQMTDADIGRYLNARNAIGKKPVPPDSKYNWSAKTTINENSMGPATWWDAEENLKKKNMTAAEKEAWQALKDSQAEGEVKYPEANDPWEKGKVNLYWIYFGDIIAAMLEQPHIKKEMDKHNIDIVLGQAVLVDSFRGLNGADDARLISVNLADIPVSLELLNDTFRDRIIKPKVTNMPMLRFIKILLNNILTPVLNSRCRTKKTVSARTTQLSTVYHTGKNNKKLPLSKGRTFISDNYEKHFLRTVSEPSALVRKDRRDYLIINAHDGGLSEYAEGEENDLKKGIMHYNLASDRGLLKSCSFKKSDIPYARELYMAGALSDQDTENTSKLWNVYNADMSLFGHPNIKPYFMVYINPSMPGMGFIGGSGVSGAMALKLGGYYRAIKVSNSISISSWETRVECMYERSVTATVKGATPIKGKPILLS